MTTIFVSDLHLSENNPEKIELFERFLGSLDCNLEALYILGDLFEQPAIMWAMIGWGWLSVMVMLFSIVDTIGQL